MSTDEIEPLITLDEAARILGVSVPSVRRFIAKKHPRLKAVRVSDRRYRTKVSWINDYIAALNPVEQTPTIKAVSDSRRSAQIDRELMMNEFWGKRAKAEYLAGRPLADVIADCSERREARMLRRRERRLDNPPSSP